MSANIYNTAAPNNSSPCCPPAPASDDVSLFLQQILLRPSPSSSITRRRSFSALSDLGPAVFSTPGQIPIPDPNPAPINSSSRFGPAPASAEEYDYVVEDVVEAVVEGAAAKPPPCRSSSKRSRARAADVHNQSEKRRRSRINEKMRALQNLIPNSNKTDKASMLDEAIEYLKQLQLQVQMLTMKNGLTLQPFGVPEMRMDDDFIFSLTQEPSNENPTTSNYMVRQNISAHPLIRCTTNEQRPVMDFSCVKVKSESTPDHFSTYQHPSSSKGKVRTCQPPDQDCLLTSLTGSKTKETTFEACLAGGDHLLQNFVNHPMFSQLQMDDQL